jgi:hypothetical protein
MINLGAYDTDVKQLLKTSSSIKMIPGCTAEYNINSMTTFDATSVVSSTVEYVNAEGSKPFKKLFPVDSVVKTNRPFGSGIKYYINGDVTSKSLLNPKAVTYPYNYRTYIAGSETYYKYWISKKGGGVDISIKYATSPMYISTNKITVKFELGHSTPQAWSIKAKNGGSTYSTLLSGNSSQISTFGNNNAGEVSIYYNGTSWSIDESSLSYTSYASYTDIKLEVNAITDKYIAVIEIAPKIVKDISDDLVSFDIQKEASSSQNDLVPVGYVSANSLTLNLNRYDVSNLKYIVYNKQYGQMSNDVTYLYKNVLLKPFFKLYTSDSSYINIPQGVFYMNSWSISEFGDTVIEALDGSKILMDITCPDMLCENFSSVAIIRRLLDTIGFTNYYINIKSDLASENGIINPQFWWSQDNKTVWQTIQELCRDIQMTAFFDENNVLQFYTRDHLYDSSKLTSWKFNYSSYSEGDYTVLPNILSLNKTEFPAANKVKVLWNPVVKSNYLGESTPLWKSDITFLGALALKSDIDNLDSTTYPLGIVPDTNGKCYINLNPVVTSKYSRYQSLFSYSGYLLINSEVIEFDAVEYKYAPSNSADLVTPLEIATGYKTVDLENSADNLKYFGRSKLPSAENFFPTGRYRVKTRAALGTARAAHKVITAAQLGTWKQLNAKWL